MRTAGAALAVGFVLSLLFVSLQGVGGKNSNLPGVSGVPTLTNYTLLIHLEAVATSRRELIFTTTSAWTPAITDMLKNFVFHLHAVDRDGNTMIISQDQGTCQSLQALGILCYVDELSPRSWEFPAGHRYGERPWDFGKIWWSLRLAELGYTALYLDNDVAAVADPLAANITQTSYDVQGLSDFRSAELPQLGAILDQRCELYRLKADSSIPGGDVYHPKWELKPNDTSLRALAPCQSLGAFYIRPTAPAMKFLAALSRWMNETHMHQWDQSAWQEVVTGFLIGMGNEEPLRYRILPPGSFMNLEIYEQTRKNSPEDKPVLLHAGYLNGEAKKKKFQELELWRGDSWQPEMGAATLAHRRRACSGALDHCMAPQLLSGTSAAWIGAVALLILGGRLAWRHMRPDYGLLPVVRPPDNSGAF